MQIIYADSLFLLNGAIDYILLLCAARICAVPLRRARYAAAAAAGGVYSVLCALPTLPFLVAWPVKLAAAVLLCVIAYGGEVKFFRCAVTFLAVSAAFGGAVFAVSMAGGGVPVGGIYLPVSLRVLALSFAVCYAAVSLVFRRAADRTRRRLCRVCIELGGRRTELSALLDTGNGLYDPISGRRVMVAGPKTAAALLPELHPPETPDAAGMFQAMSELPELRGKVRLVPYSAVGVGAGLLPVFSPELLTVDGRPERDLLVGVSPTPLSGDYEGLL